MAETDRRTHHTAGLEEVLSQKVAQVTDAKESANTAHVGSRGYRDKAEGHGGADLQ